MGRLEPFLTLAAFPPLVLREIFPVWAQALALAWLAGLWAMRRARTGRWTAPLAMDAPVAALLLTLPGAIRAATLTAPDIGRAAAVSRAESLIFAIALSYALANWMRRARRAWLAAGGLLLSAMALVVFGLVGIDWLTKYGALTPFLARLPRLIGAVPHATLQTYGEAGAIGVHPNSVAALLVLFIPLAFTCLSWPTAPAPADDGTASPPASPQSVESGSARPASPAPPSSALARPRWIRPLAAAALCATLPLLVLTQSRGAWLGLAGALLGMAALRWRPVRGALAGAAVTAALIVALAGPAEIGPRLAAASPSLAASLDGRLRLWREAGALLQASPVFGIGLNTFVVVHGRRPEYGGGFVYQGMPHAHNTLLQAALDYGLPGFVAVVGLYAAVAGAAWRAHRRLKGTPPDAVVIGLAFGLLAHALHGLIDAVAIGGKPGFVPWALAGVLMGIRAHARRWGEGGEESDEK